MKEFHEDPPIFLLQECNKKANKIRLKVEKEIITLNIPFYRLYLIFKDRIYQDAKVAKMIRLIDKMKY